MSMHAETIDVSYRILYFKTNTQVKKIKRQLSFYF